MSTESEFQLEEFIEHSDLVTEVYGDWPKFEGAYVYAATLESHSTLFYELGERTLTLDLHWWTAAPDQYIHVHTFHCSNASIDSLDMVVSGSRASLKCVGGFELACDVFDAKVLSVIPCDEIGTPINPENAEP
jgi:hypothetical protein